MGVVVGGQVAPQRKRHSAGQPRPPCAACSREWHPMLGSLLSGCTARPLIGGRANVRAQDGTSMCSVAKSRSRSAHQCCQINGSLKLIATMADRAGHYFVQGRASQRYPWCKFIKLSLKDLSKEKTSISVTTEIMNKKSPKNFETISRFVRVILAQGPC